MAGWPFLPPLETYPLQFKCYGCTAVVVFVKTNAVARGWAKSEDLIKGNGDAFNHNFICWQCHDRQELDVDSFAVRDGAQEFYDSQMESSQAANTGCGDECLACIGA